MGYMNDMSFKCQWTGGKGREIHMKVCYANSSERRSRGRSLLPDRQCNSSGLFVEGGWHPFQETERSCKENLAQMPQEQSDGLSPVPLWGSKSQRRCTVQRKGSPGVGSMDPHLMKTVQMVCSFSGGFICKQEGIQSA